jgi:cytochrome c556
MKTAAAAGDAAAYGAALEVIGGTCGECHQDYRGR